MECLHNLTKMGELGTRLRFLTARQVESSLTGAFPSCRALLFGSSVNGFGKAGCDLDLVMQLGGVEEGQVCIILQVINSKTARNAKLNKNNHN